MNACMGHHRGVCVVGISVLGDVRRALHVFWGPGNVTAYIYIYIYIYRERDRCENEHMRLEFHARTLLPAEGGFWPRDRGRGGGAEAGAAFGFYACVCTYSGVCFLICSVALCLVKKSIYARACMIYE